MPLNLPPPVLALFAALRSLGFSVLPGTDKELTYRVEWEGKDYGYVNGQVLKSGGVLGYHFQEPSPKGNDACPKGLEANLVQNFAERYECGVEDFFTQLVGGSNAGRVFLLIRDINVALRIIQQDAGHFADEGNDRILVKVDGKYVEGRLVETQMTRRERNPKARAACLEAHGFICFVCGENLRALYVGLPAELIHVHHEEPLSETMGPRTVDPVEMMKPLCPNCHCVLHSKRPPYTLEEVRHMRRGETG